MCNMYATITRKMNSIERGVYELAARADFCLILKELLKVPAIFVYKCVLYTLFLDKSVL